MAVSNELYYAVLAMDAYNRVNRVSDPLAFAVPGTIVGFARLRTEALESLPSGYENAGFFATAYDLEGEVVISYRGTDFQGGIDELVADVFNGWIASFGTTPSPQLAAAELFYETVAQRDVFEGAPNVVLTGHSLGGGLAGYIGSLNGSRAVLFNHMPFEEAAVLRWLQENAARGVTNLATLFDGSALPLVAAPDASSITGISTDDEILEFFRANLPLGTAAALSTVYGPFALGIAAAAGVLRGERGQISFDSHSNRAALPLHSQGLLVSLMFAEENDHTDWQSIGVPLIAAFFDKEISEEIGFGDPVKVPGYFDPATKLQTAIAYTVIDEGQEPFGSVAIRAWFDDADELGKAVSETDGLVADFADSLSRIITQYAGELAFRAEDVAAKEEGVITVAADGSSLAVDLSQTTWAFTSGYLGVGSDQGPTRILGRDEIFNDLKGIEFLTGGDSKEAIAFDDLYGADGEKRFGRLVFDLVDDGAPQTLPAPGAASDAISFFAGTTGGDDVRGADADHDEVIYGGDGNDTLRGRGGKDLLLGGDGDDRLELGWSGDGAAVGGNGKDIASLQSDLEATAGVTITALRARDDDGVEIDVSYQGGVQSGNATHRLFEAETLFATDEADSLIVTDDSVDADIIVDLGLNNGAGRDLVDFSGLSFGVRYDDGSVKKNEGLNLFDEKLKVIGAEHIILTDHDDVFASEKLVEGEGAILLETGAGKDRVNFTPLVGVSDLSSEDRILLGGLIPLFGGARNALSESEFAKGLGGLVEYAVNTDGELVIELPWLKVQLPGGGTRDAQMFILNWQDSKIDEFTGAGGITLFEFETRGGNLLSLDRSGGASLLGVFERLNLTLKTVFGPNNGIGGSDPLVLDLDGDGFELTNETSASPRFDIDNDGFLERTAFVKGDDALLARDLNGDGDINDASELFGFGRTSGFSILATLDGNGDGKVDAGDNGLADFNGDGALSAADSFSSLLVWRDLDRDAVSDAGELGSVGDYGITSFSLGVTAVDQAADGGNRITGLSTFTRSDGTTGGVADVRFDLDNLNTVYAGPAITVSAAAAALPNLKNTGTLVTLREALSVRPENIAEVEAALATLTAPDLDALAQAVRPVLYAWVEGSPLKQADGSYLTGPAALTVGHDLTLVKSGGSIIDYNWGLEERTVTLGGVTMIETTWSFASGREFIQLRAEGTPPPSIESFWEFGAELAFREELVNDGGEIRIRTTYQTDRSETFVSTRDADAPRASESSVRSQFVNASGIGLVEGDKAYTIDHLVAADLAVQARYLGETLDIFYSPPGTASGGAAAVSDLLTSINETFKLLAVRLAVQDGPLSEFFTSIQYDAARDKFAGTGGQQLQGVFTALFEEAALQTEPLEWYREWADFLDVLIGDFSRGGSHLLNTHGFLVQNIVTAIETVDPGFSLIEAAAVVGVPPDVFKLGTGLVEGSNSADIFYLDGSDQTLRGGGGLDTYVVGGAIGHDVIDDRERLLQDGRGSDLLRFSAHNSSEFTAARNGIDLILTVTATGETITIKNQFDGQFPSFLIGDASDDTGVREIIFADGEVWSDREIAFAVSRVDPGDTALLGTRETDVLEGGAGDDLLIGGGDADIYIYNPGDGDDVIHDQEDNNFRPGFDVLRIGGGLSADDLTFFRNGGSNDVTIGFGGLDGSITLRGQFNATETGVFGTWWLDRIEIIAFDDGTGLNFEEVMDRVIAANTTAGDDAIYGFSRADRLDGGAGNDFLSGGDYNDTYVFGYGYGADVIDDRLSNILTGRIDRLELAADVSPDDLIFVAPTARTNDLTFRLAGSTDELTIVGQNNLTPTGPFGIIAFNQIEQIVFTDGSGVVWNAEYLRRQVLEAAKTDGDDHIFGYTASDTLDGGAGNDTLEGYGSSDLYVFGRGGGHDVARDLDENILLTNTDAIDFGALAFAEVTVSRDRNDLIFTINDTGETIRIEGQYARFIVGGQVRAIEEFRFADQTVSFLDLNPEDIDLVGGAGDDTLIGTRFAETFNAREGNDVQQGGADGDTYIFGTGYGSDVIDDIQDVALWNRADTVRFTAEITPDNLVLAIAGADLVITISGASDVLTIKDQFGAASRGVERFEFANGVVWTETDIRQRVGIAGTGEGPDIVIGDPVNPNVLDGREGDDELRGGAGSDTYLFGVGYDRDRIIERADSGAQIDAVVFSQEITPDSFTLVRDGADMVLRIFDSGDELRIVDAFAGKGIEQFRFADGTIWTLDDIRERLLEPTAGDDQIFGFDARNDVLGGGLGDDALAGGTGDDVYRFNIGDGRDTVLDSGGAADAVEFGDYIALENVRFEIDGQTIVMSIDGFDDSLAILNGLDPAANRIEEFRFADGRVLSFDALRGELIARQKTDGGDVVTGFTDRDDSLEGGAGADALSGLGGNDLYLYERGGGVDLIDDKGASSSDRLVISGYVAGDARVRRLDPASSDAVIVLAGGDEIIIRGALDETHASAIEEIAFDDVIWTIADLRDAILKTQAGPADETIFGFVTPDTIAGAAGDDVLSGGGGGDSYVFNRGDGFDIISDAGNGAGDRLVVHGVAPSEATVRRVGTSGTDLRIDFGLGDSVLLRGNLGTAAADQIEEIVFDDGTIWTNADFKAFAEGGYRLNGGAGADTLTSTLLNDTLQGGNGNDTYIYALGDGHDVIFDGDLGGSGDRLLLGPGILPSEVAIRRDGTDGILTFSDGGTIRLDEEFSANREATIDQIVFANGTIWTRTDLQVMIIAQSVTAGDDRVEGYPSGDTLYGGQGSDTLVGGDGFDRYLFNVGDGHDFIIEQGFTARTDDRVIVGGYAFTEITRFESSNGEEITFRFGASGDAITIVNTSDGNRRVDFIDFADGTKTITEFLQAARNHIFEFALADADTPGDDAIVGSINNEQLTGGLGRDTLTGGDGSDRYVYAAGDGLDVIDDRGAADTDVLHIAGYAPGEVTVQRALSGSGDFYFTFAAAGDVLRIINGFEGNFQNQIEQVTFDDGTVWTPAQIVAFAAAQPFYQTIVTGGAAADTLSAAGGNFVLRGGTGGDTYVFSAGDGEDRIDDNGNGTGLDRLVIHGYAPSDVQLSNAGDTLTVRFAGSTDSIEIVNTLSGFAPSLIEEFAFDDGTVWNAAQIRAELFADLNDGAARNIGGSNFADTIAGGQGADTLRGRDGNDVYVFNAGDGADFIDEQGVGADRLVINGYAPQDAILSNAGETLTIRFAGTTDSITINRTLSGFAAGQIEEIAFTDAGVVWNLAQIRTELFADLNDAAGRLIEGTSFADTIAGGAGTDTLQGRNGADLYVFRRGDGSDEIQDRGGAEVDRILIEGYAPGETQLSSNGVDLTIRFAGTADVIFVRGAFDLFNVDRIEEIAFADGTLWNALAIRTRIIADAETPGADSVGGFLFDDTLTGGFGDDTLIGRDGADTYAYQRGDGFDVVHDQGNGDIDRVVVAGYGPDEARFSRLSPGSNDLLISFGGADRLIIVNALSGSAADTIEEFVFDGVVIPIAAIGTRLAADAATDGADILLGTASGDTLAGGLGDDLLDGGAGADIYRYQDGDGDDRIVDAASTGDRLLLEGVDPSSVSVRRSPPNGFDLILGVGAGQISIANGLAGTTAGVEEIVFDDGTIWTPGSLQARIIAEAASASDDRIWGFAGADTIAGGAGDDTLIGSEGGDLYRFSQGDGADIIEDDGGAGTDRLDVTGYASTDVGLSRLYLGSNDLVLTFAGSDDRITLFNTLDGSASDTIEEIAFADGVVWTPAAIAAMLTNNAPVAGTDSLFPVRQGEVTTIAAGLLLENDFDADGDAFSIVAVKNAERGSVSLDQNGDIAFMIGDDFEGVATFEYTISDGEGGLTDGLVYVRVEPAVTTRDDAGVTASEDTALLINASRLLANDVDGDRLSIAQVGNAVNGTVLLTTERNVIFTPAADFIGAASFTYTANLPNGGVSTSTVRVDVVAGNDAPTATADSGFTLAEGGRLFIDARDLLANDIDIDGDALALQSVGEAVGGSVSLNSFGDVVFSAAPDFFGTARFDYVVADPSGGVATGRVFLTVTPVNDAPLVLNDAGFATDEDILLFIGSSDLLANDSDPDGDPLTLARIVSSAGGAATLLANGTIEFRPAPNFFGAASFVYEAVDGQGGASLGRVDIAVAPINDAPRVVNETGASAFSVVRDNSLVFDPAALLANDSDIDGDALEVSAVHDAVNGSVGFDAEGRVVFTPDAGFSGLASFNYSVRDGQGGVSLGLAHVNVLGAAGSVPVANDDAGYSVNEDGSVVISAASLLANDTDADNHPLSLISVRTVSGSGASVSINAAGDVVYAPAADFSGVDRFEYRISDGVNGESVALVDVVVVEINDAPVAGADAAATSLDAPLVLRISDLLANDSDVEDSLAALSIIAVENLSVGAATIVNNEFIVIEAPLGFSGALAFNYVLADTDGGEDRGAVSATIAATPAGVIAGTVARDLLLGSPLGETLIGLDGADTIEGRGGDDVIVSGPGADAIHGGAGFDSVDYSGSNAGLRVDLNARVGLGGHAEGDLYASIEAVIGSAFADELYGDAGANRLIGGAGSDTISGANGADTLEGGASGDRYEFAAGFGADLVRESAETGTTDRIQFAATIAAGDVFLSTDPANAANLLITHAPSGSMITVEGHFAGGGAGIEEIAFANGTLWDRAAIDAAASFVRAPNQSLTGTTGADTLTGGTGHDTLTGRAGSDTYNLTARHGNDVIRDVGAAGDIDRVFFDSAIAPADIDLARTSGGFADLLLINRVTGETVEIDRHFAAAGTEGVEEIRFADGTIWTRAFLAANAETRGTNAGETLIGSADAERLRGGLGADTLNGANGSDDYRWSLGDGDDVIDEFGLAGDVDRLVFGAGIAPGDVDVLKSSNDFKDLFLVIRSTGERITIDQHFDGTTHGIEEVAFADGTVWSRSDLVANALLLGTAAGELLRGNSDAERIRGGAGDDDLLGNAGSDDYLFGADDGADLVDEFGAAADFDRIIFDAGVAPTDILLTRGVHPASNNNTVFITNVVTGAVIEIDQQRASRELGVEEIRFADGTVWDRAAIEALSANAPPVILDLDGDGVELLSARGPGVFFDFDGDGARERGGWIGADDGVLALDRNGDGRINGVSEISFLGDRPGAASDLEGLGAFDSDGDGALTAADAAFGSFLVWQDRNSNGISDAGELMTLAELGVRSLSPVGEGLAEDGPVSLDDNSILRTGTINWENGRTSDLADVALRYREAAPAGPADFSFEERHNRHDFWITDGEGRGRLLFPRIEAPSFDRAERRSFDDVRGYGEERTEGSGAITGVKIADRKGGAGDATGGEAFFDRETVDFSRILGDRILATRAIDAPGARDLALERPADPGPIFDVTGPPLFGAYAADDFDHPLFLSLASSRDHLSPVA
jgi:Ca2+-binding RTX toxin-like protein